MPKLYIHCPSLNTRLRTNPPVLHVRLPNGDTANQPCLPTENNPGWFRADLALYPPGDLTFHIALPDHRTDPTAGWYHTRRPRPGQALWLQGGQLFTYAPPPVVSPPQVLKLTEFHSRLPTRPLYIYLPRGYAENVTRRYPVLYLHDGQNCFDAYLTDSYANATWQADTTATRLIESARLPEIIIVAVGHGGVRRIPEYLLPSVRRRTTKAAREFLQINERTLTGRADLTAHFYREDVLPYINGNYRTLAYREHTAFAGSSMGGVFTLYLAFAHPSLARNYAALSPAVWLTAARRTARPHLQKIATHRPDVRLWLDSGTRSTPTDGDDDAPNTAALHQHFQSLGFTLGVDYHYLLDHNATHSESAWAARLPHILQFLFPLP